MAWGTFGLTHILTLIFALILNIGLYLLLKRLSKRLQVAILFILSLSGIAAIIYNLTMWGTPLLYLPFHLCSLNAMVLPFAVLTRNKIICNLTLLWSLGAACAIILNHGMTDVDIFDHVFAFYFYPHVFEMSVPILLFKLGLTKLDARCTFSTLGITGAVYTAVHFINIGVNSYAAANSITYGGEEPISVNYMYSLFHDHNPALKFFYDLLPHEFWYMLPAILIAGLYLGAIYGVNALINKKP